MSLPVLLRTGNIPETFMTHVTQKQHERRFSTTAVLLPWLAAPLFCLLPIGGCAVATTLRPKAVQVIKAVSDTPGLVAVSMPQ
jgi:hypothetical protein